MLWLDFGPMLHGMIQHGLAVLRRLLLERMMFFQTNLMMVIGLAHPKQNNDAKDHILFYFTFITNLTKLFGT